MNEKARSGYLFQETAMIRLMVITGFFLSLLMLMFIAMPVQGQEQPSPEEAWDTVKERLHLTAEQEEAIRPII